MELSPIRSWRRHRARADRRSVLVSVTAAGREVPESRWPPAPLDDGRQLA
ncbi:MAG TPA: hypothetical protein VF838_19580 [Trebonia sp.]